MNCPREAHMDPVRSTVRHVPHTRVTKDTPLKHTFGLTCTQGGRGPYATVWLYWIAAHACTRQQHEGYSRSSQEFGHRGRVSNMAMACTQLTTLCNVETDLQKYRFH